MLITAIDGTNQQLTVGGPLVKVTSDTVITRTVKKIQEVITFDDLKVGMTVKVCRKMVNMDWKITSRRRHSMSIFHKSVIIIGEIFKPRMPKKK